MRDKVLGRSIMSATPIDSRLAHLEGAYDQISDRLNSIDRRFDGVERKLDDLSRRIESIRDALVARMDRQFLWLLGVMILSIILPLVGRLIAR
jgi:septal ring factor EnvC (AmiA/AmiB activator)